MPICCSGHLDQSNYRINAFLVTHIYKGCSHCADVSPEHVSGCICGFVKRVACVIKTHDFLIVLQVEEKVRADEGKKERNVGSDNPG